MAASAVTRPAAMAACACARLSNKPRSTSRRSMRTRAAMDAPSTAGSDEISAAPRLTGLKGTKLRSSLRLGAPELHRLAAQVLAQRLECRADDALGIEPGLGGRRRWRILTDEDAGQHHRTHLEPAVEHAAIGERMQYLSGKAADGAFLDGDEHLVLAREAQQEVGIERLGET